MSDATSEKHVEIKVRVWRDKLGKWEDERTVLAKVLDSVGWNDMVKKIRERREREK